ncbi:hypothetical protein HEP73_03135 [Xanthomonas sp. GW]|nr:hypothetical protein HEP73_03135 [Xanthomonas sp. GW]
MRVALAVVMPCAGCWVVAVIGRTWERLWRSVAVLAMHPGCSLLPPGPWPPFRGRCPEGADEGPGVASCTQTPRAASRRTLTPTPLPAGEGLRLLPSPIGRRCPEGADEGTGEASCTQIPRVASRRTLTPNPSPGGEGLRLFPSPTGRRCPAGADEGTGAASCTQTPRAASRRTLTPTPLSHGTSFGRRRERGYAPRLKPARRHPAWAAAIRPGCAPSASGSR